MIRVRAVLYWAVGLGLGLGLCIGAAGTYLATPRLAMSDEAVIARARSLGMRPLTELAGAEVTLTVGPGTTAEQLAQALQESGLLSDRDGFLARVQSRAPKVGLFHLRPGLSLDELLGRLLGG